MQFRKRSAPNCAIPIARSSPWREMAGMVKREVEVAGLPDWHTDLKNLNFAKLAEAIGIEGICIEDPADLSSGLKHGLDHPGAALIDVVTDPARPRRAAGADLAIAGCTPDHYPADA